MNHLSDVVINSSDALILFCSVTGTPLPEISWIRATNGSLVNLSALSDDRISINSSNCLNIENCYESMLTILNASNTDAGEYTCQGSNFVPDVTGMFSNFSTASVFVQGNQSTI